MQERINLTRETGSLFRAALLAGFLEDELAFLDESDVEVFDEDLFLAVETGSFESARERAGAFLETRKFPDAFEEVGPDTNLFAFVADRIESLVRSLVWRVDDDQEEVDVEELFRANAGDLAVLGRLVGFANRAAVVDLLTLGGGAGATTSLRASRRGSGLAAKMRRGRDLLATSLRERGSEHVRVLRVLSYEGPAEAVAEQLGRSLPDGIREFGKSVRIVIVSDAPEFLSSTREG
jgi:hypothetical protein